MRKLFCMLVFACMLVPLGAQDFEVPKDYVFKTEEDYARYEPQVLKGIDWLLNTQLGSQREKRIQVNSFVVTWLTGAPNVSVNMRSTVANFAKANADLVIVFMCGWTRYELLHKANVNELDANVKSIQAVMDFYVRNKAYLSKDALVEKYLKLNEQGKLTAYLSEQIKS